MDKVARPDAAPEQARAERFDRSSRWVLGLVVLIFTLTLAQKGYRLSLPTEGWSSAPPMEAPIFTENLLDSPSPLQPGDQLLAIEGTPYLERIVRAVLFQSSPLEYRAGGSVLYTVLREGQELSLEVPLYSWSLAGLARVSWQTLVATPMGGPYLWLALLLSLYVFWRRPRYRSAQLFFLLQTVTASIALSGAVAQVTPADILSPALFYLARFSGDLFTWLLLPPLGLHFILSFPKPKLLNRWTLPLLYGLPWLALAVVWLTGYAPLVFYMSIAYGLLSFAAVLHMVLTLGSGPQRAQVRWFGFGYGFSSLMTAAFFLHHMGAIPEVPPLSSLLFTHCLCDLIYVVCIAIAILWHRLFDIDVVLKRTLVYGGLTAGVIGLYALLVGVLGGLLRAQGSLALSLAATGLIAVLFDPLRSRLQRAVNRLLYGYRDEPYQALTQLGRKLESVSQPQAVLPATVRTIAETLKLPYAAIALGGGVVASHGAAEAAWEAFPLSYGGEVLGELVVSPRPTEAIISRADRRLLSDLARQVGVAAHALLLQADLERSRLRLVSAREEARRRLGNDLHDSVGHQLTGLLRRAETASQLLERDPESARRLLCELVEHGRGTIEQVRLLAHQLHPPELEVLGLVDAIREHAQDLERASELQLRLEVEALPKLPAAVEVAAYRIAQEALGNVLRHARATRCQLRLRMVEDAPPPALMALATPLLELEVMDDGCGLPAFRRSGLGLSSMRERAAEVGGLCWVEALAQGGTRVLVRLPCPRF